MKNVVQIWLQRQKQKRSAAATAEEEDQLVVFVRGKRLPEKESHGGELQGRRREVEESPGPVERDALLRLVLFFRRLLLSSGQVSLHLGHDSAADEERPPCPAEQ